MRLSRMTITARQMRANMRSWKALASLAILVASRVSRMATMTATVSTTARRGTWLASMRRSGFGIRRSRLIASG